MLKNLGLVILILAIYFSRNYASAANCESLAQRDTKSQKALDFLNSINGYYLGDNCQVSIQACENTKSGQDADSNQKPNQMGETKSTLYGEILVVEKSGRELYLPLDFRNQNSAKTRVNIINGKRVFHYEYRDSNKDPEGSDYEAYLFEAVKNIERSALEYVEFGIIEKKDKRVHWLTCHNLKKH